MNLPDAVVVGAGFSRAVCQDMPLVGDLRRSVESEFKLTVGPDLEAWLGYIAEPQPFLGVSEFHRNRALYFDVTRFIASEVHEKQRALDETGRALLRRFLLPLMEKPACFVTFNYDTLLEGYYFPRITDLQSRVNPIKLHGSIAEWWTPEASLDVRQGFESCGSEPFIVPPIAGKSTFYQVPAIRERWARAVSLLREATHLAIVGYSVSIVDFTSVQLLANALSGGIVKELTVVDPAAPLVADRLRSLGVSQPIAEIKGADAVKVFADGMLKAWWKAEAEKLRTVVEASGRTLTTAINSFAVHESGAKDPTFIGPPGDPRLGPFSRVQNYIDLVDIVGSPPHLVGGREVIRVDFGSSLLPSHTLRMEQDVVRLVT